MLPSVILVGAETIGMARSKASEMRSFATFPLGVSALETVRDWQIKDC